jgi:hypothetical protein
MKLSQEWNLLSSLGVVNYLKKRWKLGKMFKQLLTALDSVQESIKSLVKYFKLLNLIDFDQQSKFINLLNQSVKISREVIFKVDTFSEIVKFNELYDDIIIDFTKIADEADDLFKDWPEDVPEEMKEKIVIDFQNLEKRLNNLLEVYVNKMTVLNKCLD